MDARYLFIKYDLIRGNGCEMWQNNTSSKNAWINTGCPVCLHTKHATTQQIQYLTTGSLVMTLCAFPASQAPLVCGIANIFDLIISKPIRLKYLLKESLFQSSRKRICKFLCRYQVKSPWVAMIDCYKENNSLVYLLPYHNLKSMTMRIGFLLTVM